MREISGLRSLLAAICGCLATIWGASDVAAVSVAPQLAWVQHLEGTRDSWTYVDVDVSGTVHVASTRWEYAPNGSFVGHRVLLQQYDLGGNRLSDKLLGDIGGAFATDIRSDVHGVVYLSASPRYSRDLTAAFIAQLDSSHNILWKTEIGTVRPSVHISSIEPSRFGGVYATGHTDNGIDPTGQHRTIDSFLLRLDEHGNRVFGTEFGTRASDYGVGVSESPLGDVVVGGRAKYLGTDPTIERGSFFAIFDSNGTMTSTELPEQIRAAYVNDATFDQKGDVIVTGWVAGSYVPVQTFDDVFVAKFGADGSFQWMQELSTFGFDEAHSITVDGDDNIYVAGQSGTGFPGVSDPPRGGSHAFVSKLSADGALLWSQQLHPGGLNNAFATDIAVDEFGRVFVGGYSHGRFAPDDDHLDFRDAEKLGFVAMLAPVPEPSSYLLLGVALCFIVACTRRNPFRSRRRTS